VGARGLQGAEPARAQAREMCILELVGDLDRLRLAGGGACAAEREQAILAVTERINLYRRGADDGADVNKVRRPRGAGPSRRRMRRPVIGPAGRAGRARAHSFRGARCAPRCSARPRPGRAAPCTAGAVWAADAARAGQALSLMWPELLEPIDGAVTPRSVRMRLSLRAAHRGTVVCVDDIARMDVNELHGVMFPYLRELHNLLRSCGGARARSAPGRPAGPARPAAPAARLPCTAPEAFGSKGTAASTSRACPVGPQKPASRPRDAAPHALPPRRRARAR